MRFFDAFPFEYFYYYSTAFQKSKKTFCTVTDCGKICLFIVVSYFL